MIIQRQVGSGKELYVMPSQKSKEEEQVGQKELTEEEKAALYSVPDKKKLNDYWKVVSVESLLPHSKHGMMHVPHPQLNGF